MKTTEDLLDEITENAAQAEFSKAFATMTFHLDWIKDSCESPIEIIFAHAFLADTLKNRKFSDHRPVQFVRQHHLDEIKRDGLLVVPQYKLARFRCDFAFVLRRAGRERIYIVECDGHDFHDGNRVAAKRDKARDRAIAKMGIFVFRFTGSEIWNDPLKCASEVYQHVLIDEFNKLSGEVC